MQSQTEKQGFFLGREVIGLLLVLESLFQIFARGQLWARKSVL